MLKLMGTHSSMRPLLVRLGFVLANLTEVEDSARCDIVDAVLVGPNAGPGSLTFYEAFLELGFRAPLAYDSPRGCYFCEASDQKLYEKHTSKLLHIGGVEGIMAHARAKRTSTPLPPAVILIISHLCYSACMLVHLWALQQ